MEREIAQLIAVYPKCISKLYVFLKSLLTPFGSLDSSLPKAGSICDLGCGSGMYSIYLWLKSGKRRVIGVDQSPSRIAYAKQVSSHIPNLTFGVTDFNKAYTLPGADAYLINDVLHHIPDEGKRNLIAKVYSRMPKEGILVIKDMTKRHKVKFFLNYVNDIIMTRYQPLHFIAREDLTNLLETAGFRVRSREINGYLFPHVIYLCTKA